MKSPQRDRLLAHIGARVREARIKVVGMSQRELGYITGRNLGRGIQENERGLTMPSGDTLLHLLSHGVDPAWVLSGRGDMRMTERPKGWLPVADLDTGAPLLAIHPRLIRNLSRTEARMPLSGVPVVDQSMAPVLVAGDLAICRGDSLSEVPMEGIYVVEVVGIRIIRRVVRPDADTLVLATENRGFGSAEFTIDECRARLRFLAEVVARYTVPV